MEDASHVFASLSTHNPAFVHHTAVPEGSAMQALQLVYCDSTDSARREEEESK